MLRASDYKALHQYFIQMAGEVRVIAHRANLDEELSGLSLTLLAISNIYLAASEELERKERIVKDRNWIVGLLIIGVLFLGLFAVAAQEATAVPTAVSTEVSPPPDGTPALPPATESPEDIIGIVLATLYSPVQRRLAAACL
jgi:hypothetical protein